MPWAYLYLIMFLDQSSSFRSICLLSTSEKLIERVIKSRREALLANFGRLNELKFGFQKDRSTVYAIKKLMKLITAATTGPLYYRKMYALTTLHVANTLNSAQWDKTKETLVWKQVSEYLLCVLCSYLSDRQLLFGEDDNRRVIFRVLLKSVLWPTLWNILYDELLSFDMGGNIMGISSAPLVAFADIVAIIVTMHNTNILESVVNKALSTVALWMESIQWTPTVWNCRLEKRKPSCWPARGNKRSHRSYYTESVFCWMIT